MSRSSRFLLAGSVAALCGVAIAVPGLSQGGSRPPARYSVDAGTMSGMGAMGSGGGIGAAMSALTGGGGGQVAHELHLKLGSSQAATGDPRRVRGALRKAPPGSARRPSRGRRNFLRVFISLPQRLKYPSMHWMSRKKSSLELDHDTGEPDACLS